MKKILFLWATLLSLTSFGQVTLTGTSYSQNFDGIGSGLPTGWTVRTGATSNNRGTAQTFSNTTIGWGDTGGAFKNLASANSLASTASTTDQNNSTDRALGVRQSGTFGDPGASFELEISNTTGKTNFSLTLKHQMLSVQGRSTIWSVQYSTNGGTNWTLLDTYNDPSSFGSTSATYSFGSALNNISSTVLIRVVALTASTGSGSRDTYGIDDFSLTWSVASTPSITSSESTLTGLNYIQGFGPSTSQNFTVSASNLNPVAGDLTVTAPANFQVSNDNTNWVSSFTMAYSSNGSAIGNNNVYVRLAAGLSAGTYSGNVTISGGSASNVNVSVNGTVSAPDFITLSAVGTPYTQDFNTLPATGTGHALSTLPTGWTFFETLGNANTTYNSTDGNTTTGDTYSLGLNNNNDRALGALQSGSLTSTWGAKIFNNTGETINNLSVSYTGETWRVGTINRSDRIEFVYSTDATALNNGTWTPVTQLNYENPGQATTASGSLLHSANISHTITGLNIPAGSTFWIRWVDFNAAGADDAMGIDDVSIVVPLAGSPLIALSESTLTGFCANSSASAAQSFNIDGSDLNPATGTIQVNANNTNFEFSTDNSTFSNSLSLSYENGELSTTVFVRLKADLSTGSKTATVTVEGGGDTKNLTVSGETVSEATLAVGDLSIIGYRTTDPDQLTFVTWVDLPANTEIRFTDNGYDENGLLRTNEQTLLWNSGSDEISAGSVIRGIFTTSSTWNFGSSTGNSLNGLAVAGDNIFAYQGTPGCPSFIYGLSTNAWLTSGVTGNNNSYLPAELNVPFGNISTGINSNLQYSGTRECFNNVNDYKASIHNLANWSAVSADLNTQRFILSNQVEILGESFLLICNPNITRTLGFSSTSAPVSVQWFRNNQLFSNSSTINVNRWSFGTYYAIATFCNGDIVETPRYRVNNVTVRNEANQNADWTKICNSTPTTLSVESVPGATYLWRRRGDNVVVSTTNTFVVSGSEIAPHRAFDVFITINNCTQSTRVTILSDGICPVEDENNDEIANKTNTSSTLLSQNTSLLFYPNPVNNNYAIQISGLETDQIFSVEWIDITGKKVAQTTASTGSGTIFNHSVSGISSGLYFVNVKNQNHNFTLKVMVK